jgi:hypothetical protein
VTHRTESVIAAALAAAALAAGCGGGKGGGDEGADSRRPAETRGAGTSGEATDYARAERAMRATDYDTALKLMRGLDGYRDARKRLAEFRVTAARGKLAEAKHELRVAPSPRAAIALAKTSLRYHPTLEARRFLPRAEAALRRHKRRQRLGLENR